jgi:hypothetical protein
MPVQLTAAFNLFAVASSSLVLLQLITIKTPISTTNAPMVKIFVFILLNGLVNS